MLCKQPAGAARRMPMIFQSGCSRSKRNEATSKHEGSSSFLKKRTKKLLLSSVRGGRSDRVNQHTKSFLVLFFKKELLPAWPSPGIAGRLVDLPYLLQHGLRIDSHRHRLGFIVRMAALIRIVPPDLLKQVDDLG